ncbi:divalent-cation tolerance protein CutA [Allosphingosinicella flava]|uniref:Divalent-cation tolerance protein CutA n=1 Tax=Allosphingosinicella flava TaxID=2771430 RepID=A0A7T2GJP4_9SPHN|nr:divalent-cation tolerance protein CutA [Sphingosinicella flava]QPQ55109.1 divalent-cation tolerance protein CutA [Sphingosinicella flava]
MDDVVSVYAIFADGEEARRIGRTAVEERLAACVNILGPCQSIYRWQDAVEETEEVAAVFKTGAARAPRLIERIAALHSYDVPAITVLPVADTLPRYRAWIEENSGR